MTESTRRRGLPVMPPAEIPLTSGDEPPFLRPKSRTRVRRGRRGWSGRAVVMLQVGGVAALSVAALWAGYARVMASDRLRVGRVEVHGSRFLSEGEVRELLGPAVGENILSLDIDSLKGRLRSSPWVADATVRRTLPDTLQVEIQERVPVALVEADGLYLMDGEGTLIELFGPRTAGFDLPIVRGLAGIEGDARRDRAQRAGTLLRDLGDLATEVSEVQFEEQRRPEGRPQGRRRGPADGQPSVPEEAPDVSGSPGRPRPEVPEDRVLRPPLPGSHLREAGGRRVPQGGVRGDAR